MWLRVTDRGDGDLALATDPATLAARRAAVAAGRWTWLRQVHGGGVVVAGPGAAVEGAEADGVVTAEIGRLLAVHTADCAPLALWSDAGVVGAVHVGWRGLRAGVVDRAAEAMDRLGGSPSGAVLGPCIEVSCYAFGPADLATVVERVGPSVAGRTAHGGPALDLVAGVTASLARLGVAVDDALWRCTACDPGCYSHRARGDTGRSALVVALQRDASTGPPDGSGDRSAGGEVSR